MNRTRGIFCLLTLSIGILVTPGYRQEQMAAGPYFPSRISWERRKPSDVGMEDAALQSAVEYAMSHASTWPLDFSNQLRVFGRQLGPMPERHGDTNGTVIHNGYIVAEFGDTSHVDVTYSVARGYVASLLGLCPIQDF